MSQITLQFVLGSDLASGLIAWWGQGYGGWSHVDYVLEDGSLLGARDDEIGGKPPGVQVRPPGYAKWKRTLRLSLQTADYIAAGHKAFMLAQVGLPYDRGDIMGLILGRPIMSDGHWICSACQYAGLETVNLVRKGAPLIPQQISPNTLAAIFGAIGAHPI